MKSSVQETLLTGVKEQKILTFVTYMLSTSGEDTLKGILTEILEKYDRIDLFDIAYCASRELILNATKINLKRVLFKQLQLNPDDPDDYVTGMRYFRRYLTEENVRNYKNRFKENGMSVTTTFYYNPNVLNIKVKNNFLLESLEEGVMRERFSRATSFTGLFDFFAEYGEMAESSSPEIAMVGILLDHSGIDKHAFSLYTSHKYNETIAKLEIPLNEHYIPKRKKFQMECEERGITPDELRSEFHYTYKDFKRK
jgi:hypothetical protein